MTSAYYHKHYPNPSRSITISGLLSDVSARKSLEEMQILLEQSAEPITVFINTSQGGLFKAFTLLSDLFVAKSHPKHKCHFITVLSGTAKSVAAYLAVSGDYAYMDKGSRLVFHGISCANYSKGMTLNRESAAALSIRLDHENRILARKLATATMPRIIRRYRTFHGEHARRAVKMSCEPDAPPRQFVKTISNRLESSHSKDLIDAAYAFAITMARFSTTAKARKATDQLAEARDMAGFLAQNVGQYSDNKGSINELTVAEIISDYFFIKEFTSAESAPSFLDANYEPGTNISKTINRSLWCLALALIARLLVGETVISAHDAYWLGLIDEVIEVSSDTNQFILTADNALIGKPEGPQAPIDKPLR